MATSSKERYLSAQSAGKAPHSRVAADVGGTFTDVVVFDEISGKSYFGKTLTTPEHLVEGIVTGIHKADTALERTRLFLHGTTIAINTVIERTGANTALLTTRGFRDVYEIGRINRPEAYNLFFRKHQPLIPRSMRVEVNERLNAQGDVLVPLQDAEVVAIAKRLKELKVEAVAILFLHSYANPDHEIRAKDIIERECPGVFVTSSHELSQEYREFERTSTVATNAYIGPRVNTYLKEVDSRLVREKFPGTFFIVQSSGGLFDVGHAQRECIKMLESGPAAGVIGSRAVCKRLGLANAIAFDMGGTTAKAGVVLDGEVIMAGNIMIGGYAEGLPIQIPLIDIHEIGTGGGSIARIETGGGLRVGPQSAGAAPGPVCYALGGTEPTITDANLILGRLAPDRFLGGEMKLDVAAAEQALERECGDRLFARTGRGMALTELGQQLLPGVKSILATARRLSDEVNAARGTTIRHVRIGTLPSLSKRLISPLFYATHKLHPDIRLQAFEGSGGQVDQWIASGFIDIGLTYRYRRPLPRDVQQLIVADAHLLGPAGDRLTASPTVEFSRLANKPLVLSGSPSMVRVTLDQIAKQKGIKLDVVLEADSAQIQKEIVANAYGYTIMPLHAALTEIENGTLQAARIVNPAIRATVVLITTSAHLLSPACRQVAKLIRELTSTAG